MEHTINRVMKMSKNPKPSPATKQKTSEPIDYKGYISMIEKKAYEIYESRGCEPGRDVEDWLRAEKIIEEQLITQE